MIRVQITNEPPSSTPAEFVRMDTGIPVPADGTYYIVQHEMPLFGKTRHGYNNTKDAIPAVANTQWGTQTLAKANGDYYPISDAWQRWFYEFWDWASGFRLPVGKLEGTHVNPMNPDVIYQDYTPGSKKALYAGMIMDAKSHSDSYNPEAGARDVVTGRNLTAPRPWEWLCRPCTGALLKQQVLLGNKIRVQCIDLYKAPPDVRTLQPWQYFFGTQVHLNGSVTRYPDVKNAFAIHGYPPAGTALPLVAPGGYFDMNKSACVPLKAGDVWKPYYP